VSSSVEIRTLTTPQELFSAAAEEVVSAATERGATRPLHHRSLRRIHPKEAFQPARHQRPHGPALGPHVFFWGDERHVPPTDPDSNYRMADEAMLSKVPVPPENVFRMAAENPDAAAAAEAYEKTLRKFFDRSENPDSSPASI
jgi:6-phosphogluconolactonase